MSRRERTDEDEDLDVIDLLADDVSPSATGTAVPASPEVTERRRPRWLVPGAIAVAVVLVAAAVVVATVSRSDRSEPEVGIQSGTGDERATDVPTTTAQLPQLEPGPVLGPVHERIALSTGGRILILDAEAGKIEDLRDLPTGAVSVEDVNAGSLHVRANGRSYVVARDGRVTDTGDASVFAASEPGGWWDYDDETISAIGADRTVELPDLLHVVASVRDGFLVQSRRQDSLLVWSPDAVERPLGSGQDVTVVAAHPDRVAWHGACPGVTCQLHVTEVAADGRDVVLRAGLLPLSGPGRALGRFSPDGRYLGLLLTSNPGIPGEFALVDLSTGALVTAPLAIGVAAPTPPSTAVPFAFTADGAHVLVVNRAGGRSAVLALSTNDGSLVARVTGLGRVESIASLDAAWQPPTTPLFTTPASEFETGAVLASFSGIPDAVTLTSVDNGTVRTVRLGSEAGFGRGDFGEMILALEGGFLASNGVGVWWIPPDGDAIALGPADYLVPSSDRAEAWIVSTVDGSRRVTHVDGRDGTLRLPRQVFATPNAAVQGQLVQAVPPTFTEPGRLELWDPESGEARTLAIDAEFPNVSGAAGEYVLWFDQMCRERCQGVATNTRTGDSRELPPDLDPYTPVAAAPAGTRMYLRDSTVPGLVLLDIETMERREVPGSAGAQQWTSSANDVLVFDNGDGGGVFLWQPGWEQPQRLSTAGLESGVFALR